MCALFLLCCKHYLSTWLYWNNHCLTFIPSGYPDGIDEKKRKLSIKAMDVLNKKKHGLVQMLMDILNKKKSFRKFTCHFWPGSLRHEKLFLTGKAHHFLQRFQRLQTFNVYGLNDHISEVENVLQWERQRCTSQLWVCPYRLTHCFLLSFPFLEIIFFICTMDTRSYHVVQCATTEFFQLFHGYWNTIWH